MRHEAAMKKRFVFAGEVKEAVARGETTMEVPAGTRFSPEAADLIKEKGIAVLLTDPAADTRTPGSDTTHTEQEPESAKRDSGGSFIAVASPGKTEEEPVGTIAARSPYFLMFDKKGVLVDVLENPYRDSSSGAGPLVAAFLADKGIAIVVAANFGRNMRLSLREKNLDSLEFQGTAKQAVAAARSEAF